jgi:hypothetical protein
MTDEEQFARTEALERQLARTIAAHVALARPLAQHAEHLRHDVARAVAMIRNAPWDELESDVR